ncbi:MAG: zf-HC2 domain-containing protein [Elusimicrobia bacterium]|nr:zf-HC2 domain-containing protein [Elusimicrobiota bacterium]
MIAMLRCWSVQNLLDLYVDRRLSPRRQASVAAHLKDCKDCRAIAAQMGPVPDVAKTLSRVAAPEGLAESILREINAARVTAEVKSIRGRHSARRLTPAQAAAMVYLGLLTLGNMRGIPSQAEAPMRAGEEIPGRRGLWSPELPQ